MDGLKRAFIIFHIQYYDIFVRALIKINDMGRVLGDLQSFWQLIALKSDGFNEDGLYSRHTLLTYNKPWASEMFCRCRRSTFCLKDSDNI